MVQLRPQGLRSGVEILATDPLPGKVNFYQGNDPGKWRTEVPTFKSVLYREAYPGIDLKFYGVGQQVEYDAIIKPGADPKQVKFLYQGIKALQSNPGRGPDRHLARRRSTGPEETGDLPGNRRPAGEPGWQIPGAPRYRETRLRV